MKWSDTYRYFGRRGQVVYVLPRRYRVLAVFSVIIALGTSWALSFASLWAGPVAHWVGVGAALLVAAGWVLFGRMRGRRVVLGHGFQKNPPKPDLRWVLANIVVWSVGILLFWLILQMRP